MTWTACHTINPTAVKQPRVINDLQLVPGWQVSRLPTARTAPRPTIIFLRHASRAHPPASTTSRIGRRPAHTKDGAACCGLEGLRLFHFLKKNCNKMIWEMSRSTFCLHMAFSEASACKVGVFRRDRRSSEAQLHRWHPQREGPLKEGSNIYASMFYLIARWLFQSYYITY